MSRWFDDLVVVRNRKPGEQGTLGNESQPLQPLRPLAREAAQRLSAPLPGGDVYTDDLAPVEWLIDGSILKVAAEGQR